MTKAELIKRLDTYKDTDKVVVEIIRQGSGDPHEIVDVTHLPGDGDDVQEVLFIVHI